MQLTGRSSLLAPRVCTLGRSRSRILQLPFFPQWEPRPGVRTCAPHGAIGAYVRAPASPSCRFGAHRGSVLHVFVFVFADNNATRLIKFKCDTAEVDTPRRRGPLHANMHASSPATARRTQHTGMNEHSPYAVRPHHGEAPSPETASSSDRILLSLRALTPSQLSPLPPGKRERKCDLRRVWLSIVSTSGRDPDMPAKMQLDSIRLKPNLADPRRLEEHMLWAHIADAWLAGWRVLLHLLRPVVGFVLSLSDCKY
ncbi:hypothetical protein A0H81_14495 [Grifola frondosa]|uniref:Uncharacterized protein n=1 Tax=Grifola frondosa TaxID=5627 RepID=A0A1C7LM36_GRIFR|nr:hypothetical protein A0H81_14495 [Grifola frondosa]